MEERTYIAIDLKSFYASVECVDRHLDPLQTNLIVADAERTQKTICLAVSPSLKGYGVPSRPRLFEVVQRVALVNAERKLRSGRLEGASVHEKELQENASLAVDYIVAPPRMARYIEVSARVYGVYLKYIAPEDIHVYSIDEVFMDVTGYLKGYGLTAHELAMRMIRDVLKTTGITATAGIGTNLYLCKIAMDIVAKHCSPDRDGVRIAELNEETYRQQLWEHRPLTDFWRVGRGIARKLESQGMHTMGDVARCSLGKEGDYYNEDLLYRLFGVNAELLIDHAWGLESCTMEDIKAYRPKSRSLCSGQVLQEAYSFAKARIVAREMGQSLSLQLLEQGKTTDQVVLTVGYDVENLLDPERRKMYHGAVTTDAYGRQVPKHAHGTEHLNRSSNSEQLLTRAVENLFDRIVDPSLLVRRMTVTVDHVEKETAEEGEQLNLFQNSAAEQQKRAWEQREKQIQKTVLELKRRFGGNAVLKGTDFEEGATTRERNQQIGGHRA